MRTRRSPPCSPPVCVAVRSRTASPSSPAVRSRCSSSSPTAAPTRRSARRSACPPSPSRATWPGSRASSAPGTGRRWWRWRCAPESSASSLFGRGCWHSGLFTAWCRGASVRSTRREGHPMYARVVSFSGATDIDGGVQFVRDTVAPLLHQQNGFGGLTASADRARGVLGVLTVWQTEADRDASESAVAKARDEGAHVIGGTMTVEMFEELVVEMARPPAVGSALLIRRLTMDPAKIDANAEFFRTTVLPQISAGPGFLAARQMINRASGDG